MPLSFLIKRFGYGIRVRVIDGLTPPFTVIELRYGLYYFVQYDDGRTGYIDIRTRGANYEIDHGLTCSKGARSVRNAPVEGSIPSESTEIEETNPYKRGWFGSLTSWIKKDG